MTMTTFIKEKHLLGLVYSFRGLVYYHHSRKHGSVPTDMVLEKELRVLHLDPQAAEGDWVPHWVSLEHRRPLQ